MGNFIADAGPLAWPTLVLGLGAFLAALSYAANGRQDSRRFAISLSVTGVVAGALGTVGGIWMALGAIRELAADQRWILLAGVRESLNTLILALVFALLVGLVVSVGGLRSDRKRHAAKSVAPAGLQRS